MKSSHFCKLSCPILLPVLCAASNLRVARAFDSKDGTAVRELKWRNCSTKLVPSLQCANLDVPVDWNKPSGSTLTLFINKLPAKSPDKRIGNLYFAPGGPGYSASEYVENMGIPGSNNYSEALRERFDLIGADQRGVGKSNPITCDPDIFNTALRKNYMPPTKEGYEDSLAAFEKLGRSCLELTGEEVLGHMDTVSAAKDLEAVRAAIGGNWTFWGASYSTRYLYQYTQMYPNNIRALLLDAMLDHSYSTLQYEVGSTRGDALSLQHFFDWAGTNSTSPLHGKDVGTIYDQIVAKARENPIPAPGCVNTKGCAPDVSEWELRGGVGNYIKVLKQWSVLAQGLADAQKGNATLLAPALATEKTSVGMSSLSISCQDWVLPEGSWEVQQNREHAVNALSPHGFGFASASQWSIACRRWPVPVTNPQTPINITTITAPILMVHALWDPACNYDMAVSMQQKMKGATLLTRRGDGHGSYAQKGETSAAMERFLLDLKVPESGTVLDS